MANTKTYDKLVRDRIPEIIEKSGKSCTFRLLSDAEYIRLLDEKLQEELTEYRESGETEELADLVEVIRAVLQARGRTWEEMEEIRLRKKQERGGFDKRILLKTVGDKEEP